MKNMKLHEFIEMLQEIENENEEMEVQLWDRESGNDFEILENEDIDLKSIENTAIITIHNLG